MHYFSLRKLNISFFQA